MGFDRIDFDIIAELQKNARRSNKELAAAVGLAPSTCLERMRRLAEAGVFRGFHAAVNEAALGIGLQAMIEVRLTRHSRELVERFSSLTGEIEEVLAVYHVTGEYDFLLHIAVRDMEHLRDLLLDAFTTRPEVANLQTHLIFSHRRAELLPNYRRAGPGPSA
jgi:DNA-binding Lrp family transcriptional regulator